MTLTLQDVARAIGAAGSPPSGAAAGWSVDTRTQKSGDVYFALRGPNHDGHDYVAAAVEKRAAAVVVEHAALPLPHGRGSDPFCERDNPTGDLDNPSRDCSDPMRDRHNPSRDRSNPTGNLVNPSDGCSNPTRDLDNPNRDLSNPSRDREGAVPSATAELIVPDSERALQTLGAWARQKWGGTVIGVTGSAGKTTTKDAIAHLLSAGLGADQVGKTIGNFNNHVGVPLSLLRLPDGCTTAVIEMGMNHAGEIRNLAEIAKPQIGVVTNVGYAHVEFFDGIEGIALAKRELIEGLASDGVAVLNADDPRVARFREIHPGRSVTFGLSDAADVRGEAVTFGEDLTQFRALGVDFETTLTGSHAVMNLLAAIAVAQIFGIAPERMREAVRTFTVGKMRGERIQHNGIVIWNDCYNSNPEAAQSMLDVLRATPASRRVAVLGEMLELGHAADELHRQVGRFAASAGVDLLIGIRGSARAMVDAAAGSGLSSRFFDDPVAAGEHARRLAQPGDAFLFKGSRGVHVEQALERFMA